MMTGCGCTASSGCRSRAGTAKARSTRFGSCGGCSMASTSCTPRTARRSTARGFLPTSPLRGTTHRAAVPHLPHHISIHVPLAGDDSVVSSLLYPPTEFLSTSPLRGTTRVFAHCLAAHHISIHVPLAGDDTGGDKGWLFSQNFYPRPPCGGRPAAAPAAVGLAAISIHVPLAGDDLDGGGLFHLVDISIHVPLAGDDSFRRRPFR